MKSPRVPPDPPRGVKEHGVLRHLPRYAEVAKLDDTLVIQQQIHGPWRKQSSFVKPQTSNIGWVSWEKYDDFGDFYMISW
jgi:hypothetical protein